MVKYRYNRWKPGNWYSYIKFMLSKEMFEDADKKKWDHYRSIWEKQDKDYNDRT